MRFNRNEIPTYFIIAFTIFVCLFSYFVIVKNAFGASDIIISTNNTPYYWNDVATDNNANLIYNLSTGNLYTSSFCYYTQLSPAFNLLDINHCDSNITIASGNYSFIEVAPINFGGYTYTCSSLNYTDCKNDSSFVMETLFSIGGGLIVPSGALFRLPIGLSTSTLANLSDTLGEQGWITFFGIVIAIYILFYVMDNLIHYVYGLKDQGRHREN